MHSGPGVPDLESGSSSPLEGGNRPPAGEAGSAPAAGELPVVQQRAALLALIKAHQVVIVCGETGSGKSTHIPQFLLEDGIVSVSQKLAVTQPRRLAAVALAQRVAKEQHCKLGTKVGYSVRFDDRSSREETAIKFLTDGMLLREMLTDPQLSQYGAIMLDETHERTINTDVTLGLLKSLLASRPELKLIISSATLDSAKISQFFSPTAPVFTISGRTFPVKCQFATTPITSRPALVDAVTSTVMQIHTASNPSSGDILVFLSGQDVIHLCEEALFEAIRDLGSEIAELEVLCLYSGMPEEEQQRIFDPPKQNCRRVVLATNIAETSLTLTQVRYVVDSGIEKEKQYNSRQGIEVLAEVKCSKASAKQRMGRAGRVSSGECFRLYTQREFDTLFKAQSQPELLRSNLSSVALMLMSFGTGASLLDFPWLDRPDVESAVDAMQTLYALGAINAECELTKLGRILAEFPLDPKLARSILASGNQFSSDICVVAGMLGEQGNLFESKNRNELGIDPTGDHLTLLNIYRMAEQAQFNRRWCRQNGLSFRSLQRAKHVAQQLQALYTRLAPQIKTFELKHSDSIVEALVAGYFLNTARASHNGRDYVALRLQETVFVHPSSVLFHTESPAELLLFHELVMTSKEYMRGCLRINHELLKSASPQYLQN